MGFPGIIWGSLAKFCSTWHNGSSQACFCEGMTFYKAWFWWFQNFIFLNPFRFEVTGRHREFKLRKSLGLLLAEYIDVDFNWRKNRHEWPESSHFPFSMIQSDEQRGHNSQLVAGGSAPTLSYPKLKQVDVIHRGNPQLTWIHRNGQIGVAKSTLLLMEMSVTSKRRRRSKITISKRFGKVWRKYPKDVWDFPHGLKETVFFGGWWCFWGVDGAFRTDPVNQTPPSWRPKITQGWVKYRKLAQMPWEKHPKPGWFAVFFQG